MEDSPGVRVPPPLIYVAGLGLGCGLDRLLPIGTLPAPTGWRVAGSILLAAGAALGLLALREVRREGTTVLPHRAASALVTGGPFGWSRNPMYVSVGLLYAGASLLLRLLWPLVLLPGVLAVIRFAVIAREEAYLERRFGDTYLQYKRRVRRWL